MNLGAAVEELAASGVRLDECLMVRPDLSDVRAVRAKMVMGFRALRERLDALRRSHGTVLYMPGSYDLVHAGHAWHIHAAQEQFGPAPVVALADDDDLIRAAKGEGRPVQSMPSAAVPDVVGHGRLFELASIPKVTVAGLLPSPLAARELAAPDILAAQCGWEGLVRLLARPPQELSGMETDPVLYRAVGEYASLLFLMRVDPGLVADAFVRRTYPWSIQSWQLYLHCYLGAGAGTPLTRIMSHRDDAHAVQIAYLMHAAGIRTRYLHELEIITTTGLLERWPPEVLAERKRSNYRNAANS